MAGAIVSVYRTPLTVNVPNVLFDVRLYAGTDSQKLQAAVNAAVAAGGGTVYVPPGSYTLDTEIAVGGTNVIVQGEGIGTIIAAATNANLACLFRLNGNSTTLRDFQIYGNCTTAIGGFTNNGLAPATGVGIAVDSGVNHTLERLYINLCPAAGIAFGAVSRQKVRHCVIAYIGHSAAGSSPYVPYGAGIRLTATAANPSVHPTDVEITGCRFEGCTEAGSASHPVPAIWGTGGQRIQVTACQFLSCQGATMAPLEWGTISVRPAANLPGAAGWLIAGCQFVNCSGCLITLNQGGHASSGTAYPGHAVQGNYLIGGTYGVMTQIYGQDAVYGGLVVSGNTFVGHTAGVELFEGNAGLHFEGASITGNRFQGCTKGLSIPSHVYSIQATKIIVTGNDFSTCGAAGDTGAGITYGTNA